jgi:chemotaxis signal transduction protein
VTRLPDPPPLVCGLVAWRAHVLPVVTLGRRLNCDDPPLDRCTLLVTETDDGVVALVVDEVLHLEEPTKIEKRDVKFLDLRVLNGK